MSITASAVCRRKNLDNGIAQPAFEIAHCKDDVIASEDMLPYFLQTCDIRPLSFPRHYDPNKGETL